MFTENKNNTKPENKGFKETKLGWIPEDWEICKIDQIFRFLNSNSYSRSNLEYSNVPKGIRNIHYGDIHSTYNTGILDCIDFNIIPKVNDDIDVSVNYDRLKDGDLVIADASEDYEGVGSAVELINVGDLKIVAGLHTFALRDHSSKTVLGFRNNLLFNEKVRNELKRIATGTKVYGISKYNFKKFEVIIPPLKDQKAIANCLNTWDTAITKLDALIKAKQQLKKALMQQLLSGKKRLSGFNVNWCTNRFDYFLEYSPRPVDKPKTAFTKLGIRSHCKGTFQNQNFKPANIAIDTLYLVKPNDLIVNITFAWEGAIAIVKNNDEGALVSHRFPTYTFKKDLSEVEYFRQFIQTKKFRYLLELISPGGAGRNRVLSKKELNKLKITIPNYEEQTAIAQVLNTADQEIALLIAQHNQLQLQKKGLMQLLLTGKKRLITNG
jgi:type I restriction enzyme S subunit